MKKRIAAALAALMCVTALTACGAKAPADEKSADEYTIEPVTVENEWDAEDGTLIARLNYSAPHLAAADGASDKFQTSVKTFNDGVDKYLQTLETNFDETAGYAADQYAYAVDAGFSDSEGGEWSMYYYDELTYTTETVGSMLSVQKNYATYSGGAHPYDYTSAWNFDLSSGTFIDDVTALGENPTDFRDGVTQIICDAIEEAGVSAEYWQDYEAIVGNWNVDEYAWFTPDGMVVSFPAYNIASYAAGAQEFLITYDEISPYLSDSGKEILGLTK